MLLTTSHINHSTASHYDDNYNFISVTSTAVSAIVVGFKALKSDVFIEHLGEHNIELVNDLVNAGYLLLP